MNVPLDEKEIVDLHLVLRVDRHHHVDRLGEQE